MFNSLVDRGVDWGYFGDRNDDWLDARLGGDTETMRLIVKRTASKGNSLYRVGEFKKYAGKKYYKR